MKDAAIPKIIDSWEPMCSIPPPYASNRTAMITDVELNVGDYFQWVEISGIKSTWYTIKAIEVFKERGAGAVKKSANAFGNNGMKATKYYYHLEVVTTAKPVHLLPVEQEQ